MKHLLKSFFLLLTVAIVFGTQAMADGGLYVAAGGSHARVDSGDFDDSDTALTLRVGYMFNDIVGLEGGYYDLGKFSDSVEQLERILRDAAGGRGNVDLDLDGYSLALVLNLPLALFDIYGKIGVFGVDAELTADTPVGRFRRDESAAGPLIAVGGELDLGALNIFAEISRIDIDEVEVQDLDIASIGIKLEF